MDKETLQSVIGQALEEGQTNLNLSGLELSELPPEIGQLTELRSLDISANNLTALPPEIGQLSKLQTLNVSANNLTALPSEIGQLSKLQTLKAMANNLTALTPALSSLTMLRELDLRYNQLRIPFEILLDPRPRAILKYYFAYLTAPSRPLNEVKLLLVGHGRVGKTSLAKRLIEDDFNIAEPLTDGIHVKTWDLPTGTDVVRINVWDFGGQEIMHATHQFFLTTRSIYIVVVDAGAGEQEARLRYWLNMTTTYGGESPVIVVINKTDQHRLLLDRATLKGLYPQIAVFAETSCLIGSGIPDLRDALIAIMVGMPHIHDLMPDSWFKVKKSLEDRPDPIIPFREYVSLCRGQGVIDEKDQVTLIDFLHALGSVLYFRHHPVLVQAGVLKRGWVTEAVYRLLNNEIVKDRGGVLKLTDLPYLLDTTDYPSEYYPYILQLMEQFDLAFHFDDDACSYLIPDLLRPEAPPLDWDESANIHFWLDYSFLPRSVLSRFITRFHGFLESNRYWRGGAVVARNGCRARVRADEGINRIVIDVFGPRYQRRDFLALIRGVLHAVQPDVKVIERVPVSNSQTVSVSYAHLLRLHAGGQSQYWVEGTDGPIDVGAVLDGIASPEHQNADAQIYIGTYIVNDTTYRVRDIHTTSLAMGPGSRSVHQEGIDSETLSRILEFMASRLEALSSLSSENLSNAKQVAEDIVKEASKGDRADQTWLEERLKNLGKMGEDILDVVTATLIDPRIGMALVVRKIANKAREEAGLDPI